MTLVITILEIALSIFLMVAVLLQQRGAGLGAGFGGDSAVFTTKRGAEKVLFNLTIVLAILFFGLLFVHAVFLG